MKLQRNYMTSVGTTWADLECSDFDRFIQQAADHHGHTVEQIKAGLLRGCAIPTGHGWDATKIRDDNSIKKAAVTAKQLDDIRFDAPIEADQEDF